MLHESEQRCSDHVAAILEEQNDGSLTLTQRQERWRYR